MFVLAPKLHTTVPMACLQVRLHNQWWVSSLAQNKNVKTLETGVDTHTHMQHCRSDRIVGRFRLSVVICILATHSYTLKFYLTALAASQQNPFFWHAGPKKCYWCRVHSGFGYNVSVSVFIFLSYNCALHFWAVHQFATTYASFAFFRGTLSLLKNEISCWYPRPICPNNFLNSDC